MLRVTFKHAALFVASLTATGLLCPAATAGEPAGDNWHHDWPAAWRDSQAQSRPILMYITMNHCYSCDRMNQETYSDDKVQSELKSRFVLASINVDKHPQFVQRLQINMFPTTVIMGTDNTVIDCMSGYVGPEKMRSRLDAATAKIAKQ